MRIVLASMPWAIFNRPSIQLASLKEYLRNTLGNVDVATCHPYLEAAKCITTDTYHVLSENLWAGEAIYSSLLFPEAAQKAQEVFSRSLGKKTVRGLPDFATLADRLDRQLHDWLAGLDLADCPLVGFTVCFGQLPASLLAAGRLKKLYPELQIVLGGSTCAPDIAASLLEVFHEVDYIIAGEGEQPLAGLCRYLAGQTRDPGAGVMHRPSAGAGGTGTPVENFVELSDLNELPLPDYDDYFRELEAAGLNFIPSLPVEFSRGCWWNRCAFCNLNLQWCGYRSKSCERIIREVELLSERYRCLDFCFTDNALPPAEANRFFSAMRKRDADLHFFAEIRTINNPETYSLFRQGGLTSAQIGIEALSESLLRRMNKGISLIDNIAAMKFCAQAGIRLDGNLILEFPSSTPQEARETLRNLDFVLAYTPLKPAAFFLGHGSPVWKKPKDFGVRAITHHPYNALLYPKEILSRLQMLIRSSRGDRAVQKRTWQPVRSRMEAWAEFHRQRREPLPALTYRDGGNFIIIRQERPGQPVLHHRLKGISRKIYLACNTPVSRKTLLQQFKSITGKQLDIFLADLEQKHLLFVQEEKYLALAIRPLRTASPFKPAPGTPAKRMKQS